MNRNPILSNYSRFSLSRLSLYRITAYVEVKIQSLFKRGNLTGDKILWKRGEIAPYPFSDCTWFVKNKLTGSHQSCLHCKNMAEIILVQVYPVVTKATYTRETFTYERIEHITLSKTIAKCTPSKSRLCK